MKSIIPNIFIQNCRENLEYYKAVFGGEIKNAVPQKDLPDKLMHAELHINEHCVLFFGDSLEPFEPNANIHIFLALEAGEEIERIYKALKADSLVIYALQKTFWGSMHAVLKDKNGIIWDLDN